MAKKDTEIKELKDKKEEKVKKAKAVKNEKVEEVVKEEVSLIISPRLTEKASTLSSSNIYTFNVKDEATKLTLAKEIEKVYKVKPIKITILNHPREAVFARNKHGFKPAFKKALVTLKKGDTINFV